MKIITQLTLLALIAMAALVGAVLGLGMMTSSDGLAFAGAGIFLMLIPGGVLGLVAGYVAYFWQGNSKGFALRAGISILIASLAGLMLTGAAIGGFHWIQSAPDPDFVYISMPPETQINLAAEAVVGQEIPFTAVVTIDSKRYAYSDRPRNTPFSTTPSRIFLRPQYLDLLTAPAGPISFSINESTGKGTVTFKSPGRYRVWGGLRNSRKVQGNVSTIFVRSSEHVYLPAEDYESRLEIEFPAEVVVDEAFDFQVKRSAGPWKAVLPADTNGARYFREPPSATDLQVLGPLSWPKTFRVVSLDPVTGKGSGVFSAAGTLQVKATLQDLALNRELASNVASVRVLSWQQDVDRTQGTNLPGCPSATPELLQWANSELARDAECGSCRILSMRGLQEMSGEPCQWLPPDMGCSGGRAGPCQTIAEDILAQARTRFNLE